ncbi:hypothetical protein [Blastococcus sp. Marseille-P5729]|uniref:hypothetical protein n=1 Tax=Blastococcus sp. Marseille-P5729 TaxID=2086582 RepID=UPI00131BF662|nr:hypothetical protein [Blastococcus sp. Marseille-P5729]
MRSAPAASSRKNGGKIIIVGAGVVRAEDDKSDHPCRRDFLLSSPASPQSSYTSG